MKKYLTIILALALVISMFAGCSAQEKAPQTQAPAVQEPAAEETKPVETEAPKELSGEVNVYCASSEDFALAVKDGFEKTHPGVTLNYVLLGGGEMLTRLRAEKSNPQSDAIFGGAADMYINADADGLLMEYVPEYVKESFEADAIGENGTYVVGGRNILCICYDKTWYDTNNLPYPTTWDDLLIPELKDNVIITNPGTSTTGYMMMSSLIALRGEEDGMKYMIDLDKNIKSYAKGGSGPVNSVALGECAAGMCYQGFAIQLQLQGYENIGICVPTEGTGVEQGCAATIANCSNPDNAKAFLDWYLTDGLALYADYDLFIYPSNPTVPANQVVLDLWTQLKDADVDYAWAAENYDRLVEIWDAQISNN